VTGTTYVNSGLVNGTTYYYVVTAVGVAGESPNSNEAFAIPRVSTGGPTGLTATPGDRIVYLAWNSVLKAQSYKIKRSLTPGGPYTTIATGVTGLTYANDGLTNGVTYYYVVSAVSLGVESPNSNEASATPFMLLPGAPPNLTATAASVGSRAIMLQWGTAARARSYNLKRSTTSGGPYVTIATGITGQTYYNDSLTPGVTYYYIVSASNGAGEGPNSNEANATAR
jgi:cellulose 1,4-beta-cellobiosidase